MDKPSSSTPSNGQDPPPARSARLPKTGELVADHLRRRIARGELAIGEQLPPEEELTAFFGIARTTLREALRVLESEKLLEIRRGRGGGPVVTMPTTDSLSVELAVLLQLSGTTVGDLDHARQLIEPRLAAELAAKHTAEDIAALEEVIERAATAAKRDDRQSFASAAADLHETIIERAGNVTLAMFSRLLHGLVQQYYVVRATRSDQTLMQRAVRSYRKLLRLIQEGEIDATEDHWRKQMSFTSTDTDANTPLHFFDD